MKIMQELVDTAAERRRKRAPAAQAIMDDATTALAASGIEDQVLKAGDRAPSFALPDALGNAVALADLLSQGPVVISFYRGGWCPYCNLELRALEQRLDEIETAGASLVAISPQTPDNSLSLAEKHALRFAVLSDADNAVARQFGLVFNVENPLNELYLKSGIDLEAANGTNAHELPIPATYVVDRDGTILFAYADPDYTRRADISEILAALVSRESV